MTLLLLFAARAGHAGSAVSGPECGTNVNSTTFDPVATSTAFGAGALVIPMDSCYNPDNPGNAGPKNVGGSCGAGDTYTCYNSYGGGNVRLPFGVIYLLAENNIPVDIILRQDKLGLADYDFVVTPPAGSTTPTVSHLLPSATGFTTDSGGVSCGTNSVYYSGMPFIVEPSFAAQALAVITAFNNANSNLFSPVTYHIVNYPFSAPVLAVMASRPKPVLIDGAPLDAFFSDSGITSVAAAGTSYITFSGSGSSYSFPWPSVLTPAPSGCASSGCTTLVDSTNNRIVDVVWSSNQIGNVNNWPSMGSYFSLGGTVLAVDAARSWESGSGGTLGGGIVEQSNGAEKGAFCGAMASSNANPLALNGQPTDFPASNRFLQLSDLALTVQGNGGGADGSSSWAFTSTPAAHTEGLSNGDGYEAIAGHPTVNGKQTLGNLIYLASLNSWNGNAGNKDGGLHILYNTLLAGGGAGTAQCGPAELTRSSAVANLVTTGSSSAYAEYLGSFDWNVPSNANALGNVLYQANPADFPYTTGHFREYKPAGTYTQTASVNAPSCSATDPTSPCNWDAATKMKTFANRNVYVATGSFGNYSLTAARSLTATDSTINYVASHLDYKDASGNAVRGQLGGIDWSTAAVIESRNVGGFTSRPGIAYVGARDGMLHAFCVTPPTGSTTCYGAAVGEEIWAIIPPGIKKKMDSAYNGGTNMDWSRINVGGAIRVADISDTFGGSATAVTRTVLLVGMHDSGYIDALDVSDPNPAKVNQDGFRFLWENDGTQIVSPATALTMGPTNGATLAQVSSSGASSTATAVVVSATCYGTGVTCSVGPGFNTYVLRLADGVIVGDEQKLYSRSSSLLGAPITNDPPALPTTLDVDGDGADETVYVATLEGKVRRYTLTASGATAPTRAILDTTKPPSSIYDASGVGGCSSGVACQPIGVSPTIVRATTGGFNVLVATGGADWARVATNGTGNAATSNVSYLTGFNASSLTQFPSSPLSLGGVIPPTPSAGGSSPGVTQVPLALRAYAQPTVAGSDLYANVTTISVGSMQQLLLPLLTPGKYGDILKWSNINTATPTASGSILASGTAYAGGVGSVIETNTTTADGELFAPGISSTVRVTLGNGSSSWRNASYAINKAAGTVRNYTNVSWFDLSN